MNWNNVRIIFLRELRDQLRDRRTLFTIAVLPLLLYPLLGILMLHAQQFLKNESRIRIIGVEALPDEPKLLEGTKFAQGLHADRPETFRLEIEKSTDATLDTDAVKAAAERDIQDSKCDLVVYFPPDFAERLTKFRREMVEQRQAVADGDAKLPNLDEVPSPQVFSNTAIDRSNIASSRVSPILHNWRERIVGENLKQTRLPRTVIRPFEVVTHDVAETNVRRAVMWSKLLPLVLLVWALTGAFYPAIDLCAGEKERGTLETLLSSSAHRSEIVWGKLLTVMTFSMATSLLNLACLCFTGRFVIQSIAAGGPMQLGPPPLGAIGWSLLALIPTAALFSALSLAIATFARSSKEGQYYLMPLLLCSLPLMLLPTLPSVEPNVGFSLIPITGVMLLLRSLIEGQYWEALRYSPLVIGVTAVCCLLAIRWAIDQFNDESVLFRESERFGLRVWVQHIIRDRGDTPTVGEALLCGVLLLVIRFFASFSMPPATDWLKLASSTLILQVTLIATPACLMAIMLTRRPLRSLLLRRPSYWMTLPAVGLLAVLLHPAMNWMAVLVSYIYPVNPSIESAMEHFTKLFAEAPLWQLIIVAALSPAICEELAFRGFILSGLRKMDHKWGAIVLTSVFFGLTHSLLQQSMTACITGIVIGYIAVKTGSILPAMLYHFVHNSIGICLTRVKGGMLDEIPLGRQIFVGDNPDMLTYTIPATIVMTVLGVGILLWIKSLPYHASDEERLQQALDRQQPLAPTGGAITVGDT